MKEILEKIQNAGDVEIQVIMQAIRVWYKRNYPDWDVVYIAMEKDYEKRKEQYAFILRMTEDEQKWYESQNKME